MCAVNGQDEELIFRISGAEESCKPLPKTPSSLFRQQESVFTFSKRKSRAERSRRGGKLVGGDRSTRIGEKEELAGRKTEEFQRVLVSRRRKKERTLCPLFLSLKSGMGRWKKLFFQETGSFLNRESRRRSNRSENGKAVLPDC